MSKSVRVERDGEIVVVELNPDHFTIDPSCLDKDLCSLGRVMLDYGEVEAELRTEVARKEAQVAAYYAASDSSLRHKAKTVGEKATENQIKNTILQDETYQALLVGLRQSEMYHGLMRWAMNALNHKGDCLRAMAYRERQLMKMET
jgi:hypothetical protein